MSKPQSIHLGNIIRVKHGFAFPGKEFSEDLNFPTLLTPGNFAVGGGFREAKPKTFSGDFPKEYELQPGDLVITMTDLSKAGDTLGLPAVVPAGRRYLHNQRIGLVEVTDPNRLSKNFLAYYLRTDLYRSYILGTASGSTVRHTSPSRIEAFDAVLPPLTEQRAIAEVLGALDDKIAANTKLAKTADELAGKLFDHAAALLPTQPLSSILTPILGGTPSRSNLGFWDGEELWASARDITGAPFSVVLDTEEKITSAAVEKTKAKPLPAGGVILTARGTVGAVARLATPASFNQSCYGFLPESLPPSLLYFSVLRATAQAKALVHGSVFDTITKRTFDHVLIPEFGEAADSVEDQISPFLDLVTASVRENATLAATRDALLPQLMLGKLRVKDAEKVLESAL